MQSSDVVHIQNQRPNTVSVQTLLFAAPIAKQPFDPRIQYISSLSTEKSSASAASYHFAAVKIPINKHLRQTKIWVGAPDPKDSVDIYADLADLFH